MWNSKTLRGFLNWGLIENCLVGGQTLNQTQHSFVLNRDHSIFENGITLPGLCWQQSMEKDNDVSINGDNLVKITHPELKKRVDSFVRTARVEMAEDIRKIRAEQLEPEDVFGHLAMRKEVIQQRKRPLDIDDIIDNALVCKWLESTDIKSIPCTCKGDCVRGAQAVLPIADNSKKVIVYNSCLRTLFASFKRQLKLVPSPDWNVIRRFNRFVNEYFEKYLLDQLEHFSYSFADWFNHCPVGKQEDLLKVMTKEMLDDLLESTTTIPKAKLLELRSTALTNAEIEQDLDALTEYGLFCKREKQEDGGKNRAIANILTLTKLIMGPICWGLEKLFTQYAPGYCGNKNWDQLEDWLDENYKEGFHCVLQGDGSGFDLSQHHECKEIDRLVYQFIVDKNKVKHVPVSWFKKAALSPFKKLRAKLFSNQGVVNLGSASIYGTVFSGSSDTTLMNTMRMALYNMFTLEENGVYRLEYGRDYVLKAKGDDFMVLVKDRTLPYEDIYSKFWSSKEKAEDPTYCRAGYGLGQILKFLVIGGFETIDFCSTTVIPYKYKKENQLRFKITRKPERMIMLQHWSRAALTMKKAELKQYLLDQAMAIETSMPGMPFFMHYANAFRFHASLIPGAPKRVGSGKGRYHIFNYQGDQASELSDRELIGLSYGTETYYKIMTRYSRKNIPTEYVYQHLLNHYGITKSMIQYHYRFLKYGGHYDIMADLI